MPAKEKTLVRRTLPGSVKYREYVVIENGEQTPPLREWLRGNCEVCLSEKQYILNAPFVPSRQDLRDLVILVRTVLASTGRKKKGGQKRQS